MTKPALDEGGLPSGYPFQSEWEISPREVHRRRTEGEELVLIDCRTAQEREIAKIAGSIHIPFQDVSSRIEEIRALGDVPIVVHCHQGGRSLRMTAILRREGIDDVRSLAGGIHLWALDIDPGIPTY